MVVIVTPIVLMVVGIPGYSLLDGFPGSCTRLGQIFDYLTLSRDGQIGYDEAWKAFGRSVWSENGQTQMKVVEPRKNPRRLGYIGECSTQLYRDCNKSL